MMVRHTTTYRDALFACLAVLCVSCHPVEEPPVTDSRTGGWGLACQFDESCDPEYACVCGACTTACADAQCAQGECTATADIPACAGEPNVDTCLATCEIPEDCAGFQDPSCTGGVCVENVPGPACRWQIDTAADWSVADPANVDCTCSSQNQRCHAVIETRAVSATDMSVTVEARFVADESWAAELVDWSWGTAVLEQTSCFDLTQFVEHASGQVPIGGSFEANFAITSEAEFASLPEGTLVWLVVTTGSARDPDGSIYFSTAGIPARKVCE